MASRNSGILFISRDLTVGGGSTFLRDITPFISKRGIPAYVLAGIGKLAPAVRASADTVWTPRLFEVAPAFYVKKALRELKPAAVVVNKLKWAAKVIGSCEASGVPVFVRYNVDSQDDDKPHIAATKPRLAGLLCVCGVLAEPLRQDPTISNKVRWLPIPVANHLIRNPIPPMPENGFVVVSGNRVSRLKGQAMLAMLDILPRLIERIPRFELIVLGGGGLLQQIRRRAAEANKQYGKSAVTVVGETEDPYKYMAQGHCVLGSAHVAQEGLALGRHVVACGFKGYPAHITPDNIDWGVQRNFGDFDYEYEYDGVDRERLFEQIIAAYEAYNSSPINNWARDYMAQYHAGNVVADVLLQHMRDLGARP